MAAAVGLGKLVRERTVFLVVDIQSGFRPAIHAFDSVVATTNKMLMAAKVMEIPVIVTEQNPARLGATDGAVQLSILGDLHKATVDKKKFSALTEPVIQALLKLQLQDPPHASDVVIMGIESHICVLQTALDCLHHGLNPHVVADGVSSCNKEEIPLALARMRQSGVFVSTSESLMYQLMGDAAEPDFKHFAQVVKHEKESTKSVLSTLFGSQSQSQSSPSNPNANL